MNISESWVVWALFSAFFAALTAIFAKIGWLVIDFDFAYALGKDRRDSYCPEHVCVGYRKIKKQFVVVELTNWTFLVLSGLATGASWLLFSGA